MSNLKKIVEEFNEVGSKDREQDSVINKYMHCVQQFIKYNNNYNENIVQKYGTQFKL